MKKKLIILGMFLSVFLIPNSSFGANFYVSNESLLNYYSFNNNATDTGYAVADLVDGQFFATSSYWLGINGTSSIGKTQLASLLRSTSTFITDFFANAVSGTVLYFYHTPDNYDGDIANSAYNNSTNDAFSLQRNASSVSFQLGAGGCVNACSPRIYINNLATSTNYFFAFVWSGTNLYGYANGSLVTSTVISGGSNFNNAFTNQQIKFNDNDDLSQAVAQAGILTYALSQSEITALWNNGSGARICTSFGCGDVNPVSSATIAFGFPVQGTSTPDFSNWVILLNSLNIGTTYYGRVLYYPYPIPSSQFIFSDKFAVVSDDTSLIWATPKLTEINDNPSSTFNYYPEWNAQLFLYSDVTYETVIASSSVLTFYIDKNAGYPSSTYSQLAAPFPSIPLSGYSTSSETYFTCDPPNSVLDIGGGVVYAFCWLTNVLIQPHHQSIAFVNSQVQQFKTVFPFSVAFSVYDSLLTGASSISTSSLPSIGYTMPDLAGGLSTSTRTINLLTSSTFNVVDNDSKDTMRTVSRYVIIILTTLSIAMQVIPKKKIHST